MDKAREALREAYMSATCLLDEGYGKQFDRDILHILNQLNTVEEFLDLPSIEKPINDNSTFIANR